jgi:hypothetical protein
MKGAAAGTSTVSIRHAPWPYRAVLAICSDLDETPSAQTYLEIARFLNTTEDTAMGPGVGLEVGNSIFFDMAPGQFSYWGADDASREMVRTLVHSGHVDAIHSWGDLATERRHAERNLGELERHGCRLEVWIDHSKAASNFGPDIMVGTGDLPGAAAYHADLTLAYGVRYVWRGRTTGLAGQDVGIRPGSVLPMLRASRPASSAWAALKELVKTGLGRMGHSRWAMYGANRLCRPTTLRDGRPIWEFLRSNPSWGGPGESATADGLAEVLTPRMMARLVHCGGSCILYTHLGKVRDPRRPFGPATQASLRHLARLRDDGHVFVTTTRRLLRYRIVRDQLRYQATTAGDRIVLRLGPIDDPVTGTRRPSADDLQGLCFQAEAGRDLELGLDDGTPIAHERVATGAVNCAVIPWRPLSFPRLGHQAAG